MQGLQRRDEGETDPQFPFEVAATMGVVVRTLGVVALQAYVASGKTNAKLNHQVVDKLRAPSDGGWLELAQTLSKATAAHHPLRNSSPARSVAKSRWTQRSASTQTRREPPGRRCTNWSAFATT